MADGFHITVDSNSSMAISGEISFDIEASEPGELDYSIARPQGAPLSGTFTVPVIENLDPHSILDDIQGFNPNTFNEWMEQMANVQPMDLPHDVVDRLFNTRNTWITRVVPDKEMTEEEAYFDRLGVEYEE